MRIGTNVEINQQLNNLDRRLRDIEREFKDIKKERDQFRDVLQKVVVVVDEETKRARIKDLIEGRD